MSEPRFFRPVFVHHRGHWHHAPATYSNGADTACGLSRVAGQLIAINTLVDTFSLMCTFGRFRAAVAEEFSAEIASAPMCPWCFPGLSDVRSAKGLANLADFVVAPPSAADPATIVQAELIDKLGVVRVRLTLASGAAGVIDLPVSEFHCAQPKEAP